MFCGLSIRGSGAIWEDHDYYTSQKIECRTIQTCQGSELDSEWKWVPMGVSQTLWHQIVQVIILYTHNTENSNVHSMSYTTTYVHTTDMHVCTLHTNIVATETMYVHCIYLPCGPTAWPPAISMVLYGCCVNKPNTTTQKQCHLAICCYIWMTKTTASTSSCLAAI